MLFPSKTAAEKRLLFRKTLKTGKLLQKIIKENHQIAAEAIFVFGLFDLNTRKLVEPTTAWQVAVGLSQS